MLMDFQSSEPEVETLFRGSCRSMRGPLAHVGTLEVTPLEVSFTPSMLDRLAGARSWRVSVAELESARLIDAENLYLEARGATHTVAGAILAEALAAVDLALRKNQRTRPVEPPGGEEVLFSSSVTVVASDGVPRDAELSVTRERVHIAHVGLHRLEAGVVALDAPHRRLSDARFTGGAVTLEGPGATFELQLDEALELFLVLCGVDADRPLRSGAYRARRATFADGTTVATGYLALTRNQLLFKADDGELSRALDLVGLETVRLTSGRTEGLVVQLAGAPVRFELEDPRGTYDELLLLMTHVEGQGDRPTNAEGRFDDEVLDAVLADWAPQVKGRTTGRVLVTTPGVFVDQRGLARRGVLMLCEEGFAYFPHGVPAPGRAPIAIPTEVLRPAGEDTPTTQPSLEVPLRHGEVVRLFPRGGAAAVALLRGALLRLNSKRREKAEGLRTRRRSYRAEPPAPLSVRLLGIKRAGGVPVEGPGEATLLDVSMEGCRISVAHELRGVRSVELELPTTPTPTRLRADVVNHKPPNPLFGHGWAYGLCFSHTTAEQGSRVRELTMELQRRALARRHDD